MDPIETEEYKGFTVEIYYDESPESPREWDNLGKLVLHNLPKEIDIDLDHFGSWAEVEAELRKHHDVQVVLPVWGYDHSGLALKAGERTYPFDDAWDSGQAGLVVATGAAIRVAFDSRVTTEIQEKVEEVLRSEVESYNEYLNGQVYGYVVRDAAGEILDSCWGIWLDETGFEYPLSQGRGFIDAEIASLQAAAAEGRIP